jgi:protein TonB
MVKGFSMQKISAGSLANPLLHLTIALMIAITPALAQQTTPTDPSPQAPSPQTTTRTIPITQASEVSAANTSAAPPTPALVTKEKPLHLGFDSGVTRPVVLNHVEPHFSEDARKEKFSGTVEIYLFVDKNGNPVNVRVVRGVGHGLDEKAVEAVRQYKFKPATRNGQPVVVDLYVDVNFQFIDPPKHKKEEN